MGDFAMAKLNDWKLHMSIISHIWEAQQLHVCIMQNCKTSFNAAAFQALGVKQQSYWNGDLPSYKGDQEQQKVWEKGQDFWQDKRAAVNPI